MGEDDASRGHSRRSFLKGLGIAAGAVAVTEPLPAAARAGQAAPAGVELLGRHRRPVVLQVDGVAREVAVEPRTTLLAALRGELGVMSVKSVCERGACGACTVLVDGIAQVSCMTLAVDVVGRQLTTATGIAADPTKKPLVDAFAASDAAQCGFCIPGFLVRSAALLDANPSADAETVKRELSGNLCRCGTYPKIFAAVALAQGRGAAPKDHPRVDVVEKVTGAARYAADQHPDGMIIGRFVRAPYGDSTVSSVDVAAARKVPGVIEVKIDKKASRYAGERLGFIAAESEQAVDDALAALALTMRVGSPATDPRSKLRIPKPSESTTRRLKQAAHVVEATYTTQVQTHSSLETHGCVVDPDVKRKRAEVFASTQSTFAFHEGVTSALGYRGSNVVVHCEYVGGGFGSKFGAGPEGKLAAELAKRHKRPCKVMLTRAGEHLDSGNRPGSIQFMKVGVTADGKIAGGQVHVAGVVGHAGGGGDAKNPIYYDFGQVQRSQQTLHIASGKPRAFRAPGHPQGVFAVESMIDELAAAAGIEPLEFRRRNETSPRRVRQLAQGAERIGWARRRPDGTWPGRFKRGFGCGAAGWYHWPTRCEAEVVIHRSGEVVVRSGVQDIGTGTITVVRDAAAAALGVPRSVVKAEVGDSRLPAGPGSGGSSVTRAVVPAVEAACAKALAKLEDLTGTAFEPGGDWQAACRSLPEATFSVRGETSRGAAGEGDSDGVQLVEVEVDTLTGQVRVIKVVAIQACGRVMHKLAADNQVAGAVIQGISYALFEERRLDPTTGAMLSPNLEGYAIAGAADVPEIDVVLDERDTDTGARALGEPPAIPTAGAIANAVANAIGARVRDLPITPRRVIEAMESAASQEVPK